MKVDYGKLIRNGRKKKGWTQAQLAETLGYDGPQFISLIERNHARCPLSTLGKLIVLLDLEEEVILRGILFYLEIEARNEIESGKSHVLTPPEA